MWKLWGELQLLLWALWFAVFTCLPGVVSGCSSIWGRSELAGEASPPTSSFQHHFKSFPHVSGPKQQTNPKLRQTCGLIWLQRGVAGHAEVSPVDRFGQRGRSFTAGVRGHAGSREILHAVLQLHRHVDRHVHIRPNTFTVFQRVKTSV